MDSDVNLLITVLYNESLLKCAIQIPRNKLSGDRLEYPMEPENKSQLYSLLPERVRSCGPIVDIEEIFAIKCDPIP